MKLILPPTLKPTLTLNITRYVREIGKEKKLVKKVQIRKAPGTGMVSAHFKIKQ